jgi:hypothetical protein
MKLTVSYGTDEGLSSYKEGIGNGIRYMLGSLATTKFYRYIITVFLDMFISTPIQMVITYLFRNIISDLKNGRVGYKLFDDRFITKFIGKNFDNVLQSVVAMITFLAYTNETRFLWAYPSSSLHKDEIIPPSTIKLATSVAAIIFLVSNYPNTYNPNTYNPTNISLVRQYGTINLLEQNRIEDFKLETSLPEKIFNLITGGIIGECKDNCSLLPGKPMGDTLTKKLIYVLVTIILLTAGSKDFFNTLEPELEYNTEKSINQTKDKSKLEYIEYATKNDKLLSKNDIQNKWWQGLIIFGVLCIIGLVGPFAFSKNKKKTGIAGGVVSMILLALGLIGGLANKK